MSKKAIILMLISTLSFAFVNAIVKELERFPLFELIFFRSVVSLVISLIHVRSLKISPWGNNRKFLLIRGVAGTIGLVLFFYAIQNGPLATAVTLQYLNPIFTAIIAVWVLKEKLRSRYWFYVLISFIGILLLKFEDHRISLTVLIIGILSAVFSGIAYVSVRKVRDTDHPILSVLYFPLVATPISLLLCLTDWVTPIGIEWFYVLVIGVLTQIAQYTMTIALQSERAAKVTVLNYMGSVYALILGYTIFGEEFEWFNIAGVVLIVLGIVLNSRVK